MDVALFFQAMLNGVLLGSLISLVVVGLVLVLGVARVLNMAHGHILVLGAFFVWFFFVDIGIDVLSNPVSFVLALILAVAIVAALGIVLERVPFRRFQGNLIAGLVASVAIMMLIESLTMEAWGTETKIVGSIWAGSTNFFGVVMSNWRWVIMAIGLILMGGVALYMQRTKMGRAMRASASDPEAAALQGINPITVSRLAMIIGFGLAAIGGGVMAPIYGVDLAVAMPWILKGILAIVIGGPGSLGGCMVAALALGMTESYFTTFVNPQAGYIAMFGLLIAVILVRPWGLFGRPIKGF